MQRNLLLRIDKYVLFLISCRDLLKYLARRSCWYEQKYQVVSEAKLR